MSSEATDKGGNPDSSKYKQSFNHNQQLNYLFFQKVLKKVNMFIKFHKKE